MKKNGHVGLLGVILARAGVFFYPARQYGISGWFCPKRIKPLRAHHGQGGHGVGGCPLWRRLVRSSQGANRIFQCLWMLRLTRSNLWERRDMACVFVAAVENRSCRKDRDAFAASTVAFLNKAERLGRKHLQSARCRTVAIGVRCHERGQVPWLTATLLAILWRRLDELARKRILAAWTFCQKAKDPS